MFQHINISSQDDCKMIWIGTFTGALVTSGWITEIM